MLKFLSFATPVLLALSQAASAAPITCNAVVYSIDQGSASEVSDQSSPQAVDMKAVADDASGSLSGNGKFNFGKSYEVDYSVDLYPNQSSQIAGDPVIILRAKLQKTGADGKVALIALQPTASSDTILTGYKDDLAIRASKLVVALQLPSPEVFQLALDAGKPLSDMLTGKLIPDGTITDVVLECEMPKDAGATPSATTPSGSGK